MRHSTAALSLALSLALSVAAPLAFSDLEAEAKPASSSKLKSKETPKTIKKKTEEADLKKKSKRAPTKLKTIGAAKSPAPSPAKSPALGGKASGLRVKGAKGASGGLTTPAPKRAEAPESVAPPAPGPSQSPEAPAEKLLAPKGPKIASPKRTPLSPSVSSEPASTTTTTTTTTTTKQSKGKKGKKFKKGMKGANQTERERGVAEPSYGVVPSGGGGGGYSRAPSRAPACRPVGSVLMANLGVGFESTQGVDSSSMAYVFGGGLRWGLLGAVGEAQFNQRDGESEMTAWGGQVRLYIPLGTCLDVYPLAGMSQQKAGLEQFKGNTAAYDLGVGADLNFFGHLALGARYTRSFFVDELQKVKINDTANSRDTFVVQVSLFF